MATQPYTLPNISVQFAFQDLSTGTTPQPFSPRSISVSSGQYYLSLTQGIYTGVLFTSTLGNFTTNSGSLQLNHSSTTTAYGSTALTTTGTTNLPVTSSAGFNMSGGSVTIAHGGANYTVSYTGIYLNQLNASAYTLSTLSSTAVTLYAAPTGWPASGTFTLNTGGPSGSNYICSYTSITSSTLNGVLIVSGPTTTLSIGASSYNAVTVNQLNGAQVTAGGNFTTTAGDVITQSGNYTVNYTSASGFQAAYQFNLPTTSGAFSPAATFFPYSSSTDTITTWNWYEANTFTRDFQTKMGRQHELDRTEASTLSLKLDNRDGRWFPWNTNTFSYTSVTTGATSTLAPSSILTIGVPVRVIATWQGTQHPVFFGYVDAWQPSAPDEVNTDTTVTATDILKLLSLARLSNASLYKTQMLAPIASVVDIAPEIIRCNDAPANGVITTQLSNTGVSAFLVSGGTTVSSTSNATLSFYSPGGLGGFFTWANASGGTFNYSHAGRTYVISYGSASSNGPGYQFTGCQIVQPGNSIVTQVGDYIVGGNCAVGVGPINLANSTSLTAFGKAGVQVYDPNAGGIDLSNGTGSTATLGISLATAGVYPAVNANQGVTIEGWFQNAANADTLLMVVDWSTGSGASTGYSYVAQVTSNGGVSLARQVTTGSSTTTTTYLSSTICPSVTDGNWHLVTMSLMKISGVIQGSLFVDGVYIGSASSTSTALTPTTANWGILITGGYQAIGPAPLGGTAATVSDLAFTVDLVVTGITSGVFAAQSANRYRVGTHFKSTLTGTTITSAVTINNATGVTLPVANASSFSTTGGLANIVVNGVGGAVSYTGKSGNNLLNVTLYPPATASTATIVTYANQPIYQVQGVSTGYRLLEVAEVVGLVPDDGTSTMTTTPLNYNEGVVKQLSNEQSTTFASTALDYGFQFEDTENGFFYQDQSGTLQFLPRFYPQTHPQTSTQWSDSGTALNQPHYQLNVEVFMDDLDTWEVAQLTTPGGGTTYVADPTNTYINQYAPRTFSRGQIWASRQQDVNALGYMIVNRYRQPITRPQKVILDNTYIDSAGNQPNQLAMLSTNLWDQIVFNHDGYNTNYAQAVVVESIAHDFKAEPGQWQTTFVLSPYEMNGSSTVNAGSFFRLSTSSVAADYSKFQSAQTSVAFASTISSTSSSVQVTPQTTPSGLPYGIALPASASSGTTINHAGTNYAVAYTGKAQTNTTTSSVVSLTTSSSVTLTLASVTNFPTTGGIFYITNGAITYQCTYASVSGSTITGCKLGAQYSGITVTTASGNVVYGPQLLTGVTCASSVSLTAGDTAYYTSSTAQDTFGG